MDKCLQTPSFFCGFASSNNNTRINKPSVSEADVLLAREMNELSVTEREHVLEEVHGVADVIQETPIFVSQKLAELDQKISNIRKRTAYERALFLSPRHVRDPKLRLMFLRAEYFDARKAATRMVLYFECKKILWGDGKLVKKITLDDFDQEDMRSLRAGSIQNPVVKDQAGRTLCFICQNYSKYKTWQHQFRVMWYQLMAALEDEDTQRKGMVSVLYNIELVEAEPEYPELLKNSHMINDAMPYRNVAVHYCYDRASLRPAMTLYQLVVSGNIRLRFRSHYGSHVECQYKLLSFGIPSNSLPVDSDGKMRSEELLRYIEKRKEKDADIDMVERHQNNMKPLTPAENDVLLGRGRPFQEWHGNLQLANIIDVHREKYGNADRAKKTAISKDVLSIVKSCNGRFLQQDKATGEWEQLSDAVAREKVSSGFRRKELKEEEKRSAKDEDSRSPLVGASPKRSRVSKN